jgi:hypothetical protein
MKNIYNLLTEAFNYIEIDESDYEVTVFDYYKVKITKKQNAENNIGSAYLNLVMGRNNTLYDFTENNTLFNRILWSRFCNIFDEQINVASFVSALTLHNSLPHDNFGVDENHIVNENENESENENENESENESENENLTNATEDNNTLQ